MLLKEYQPRSELVLKETYVEKPAFPVYDCHTHWGKLMMGDGYTELYDTAAAVTSLREKGIQAVVNLDGFDFDELDKMKRKIAGQEDFFLNFGNVDVSRLDEPDFGDYVKSSLRYGVSQGIRGLKFWKPIGLGIKDGSGKYITPDDERLRVIWEEAARYSLPILFHIADPPAFFRPIDRFNERLEELGEHPDWSFCNPELYSFEQLMEMQQNLLRKNPDTTFIIAHAGSYSENLLQVAQWLEEFPNMRIAIAARIGDLSRQPYTARRFCIKYSKRIFFGTDFHPVESPDSYNIYYRILETDDEYFDYSLSPTGGQGRFKAYGLYLPRETLEDIYCGNFKRLFHIS